MNIFDEIQVPKETNFVIMRAIKKGKRHLIISRISFSGATLILCVLIYIFSAVMVPALVQTVSDIPSISDLQGLENAYRSDLVESTDLKISFNGTEVEIKEVYYDSSQISLHYVVRDEKQEYAMKRYLPLLYYNEKVINTESTNPAAIKKSDTEYEYQFTARFDNNACNLPVQFDLTIVFYSDTGNLGESRNFNLRIPVSRAKADEYTKKITLMKVFQSDACTILIKEIEFTPSNTKLSYEITGTEKRDFLLRIMDEEGNLFSNFSAMNLSVNDPQKATMLQFFDPAEKIPQKLKVSLFTFSLTENPWYELELNQGRDFYK